MKMLIKKLRLIALILPLTACLYPPFYPEAGYSQRAPNNGVGAYPQYSQPSRHGQGYGQGYNDGHHYREHEHYGERHWR